MPSPRFSPLVRAGAVASAAALALALAGIPEPASASVPATGASAVDQWTWPVTGRHILIRGFEAPATRYSAGHRGIDIAAAVGSAVTAPTAGVVRFAGVVVDRPTITLATPEGVLVSMEPVSPELPTGASVTKGAPLGRVATGGHCSGNCLHLGVRVDGRYVSPLRFFGGVPRAVLLPLR